MTELTMVELTWIEKRIERWIRFGKIVEDQILDRRRRMVGIAPGSVFAFVRWASNDYGTIVSRIDILRAVMPGEAYSTIPFVKPGGEILLRVTGWPKVERVLQQIDAVEQLDIKPEEAAPDHWRHVHNRLTAGEQPRWQRADIWHSACRSLSTSPRCLERSFADPDLRSQSTALPRRKPLIAIRAAGNCPPGKAAARSDPAKFF